MKPISNFKIHNIFGRPKPQFQMKQLSFLSPKSFTLNPMRRQNVFFQKAFSPITTPKYLFHTTRTILIDNHENEENPEGPKEPVIPQKVIPYEEALQMLSVTENDSINVVKKTFHRRTLELKNEKTGEELEETLNDLTLAFETVINRIREKRPPKPKIEYQPLFDDRDKTTAEDIKKEEEEEAKLYGQSKQENYDTVMNSTTITPPKQEEQQLETQRRFDKLRKLFSFTLRNCFQTKFPILSGVEPEGYSAEEWKKEFPNSKVEFEPVEDEELPRSRLPTIWFVIVFYILYNFFNSFETDDVELTIELMRHPTLGISRYYYQDRY